MPPAGFSLTGGAIFEFSRNDMRPPLFDAQLPHLIKALERIADGLTRPKMSLPHGMTIEPNFLHDLYYGEYEPSVLRSRTKAAGT